VLVPTPGVRKYIVIAHPESGFEKEYDVGK
jgi:hypothetical protein